MPKGFGAAKLVQLVAFDQRAAADDGYGNIISGDWVERHRARAEFINLRGGSEAIMQGRLEAHPSIIMRIRVCPAAMAIREDWRARDIRRGTVYNVRSSTNDNSRSVIDLLCEANVGT